MEMRYLGKLLVVLFVLAVPNFLPPASRAIVCSLAAWSTSERDFGDDGRDGEKGETGRRGRDGESRTIFAEGTPLNLELSGEDGGDGRDGRDGEDADCDRQPRDVNYDLRAPDGGDGGDGGEGGDGGNGGPVTVYYTNLADLKKIYVRAPGGRGGRPGRGAYGGDGCRCDDRRWEIETCTGNPGSPDRRCQTEEFTCEDGDEGRNGRDGRDGKDGSLGTLTLINRSEPLPPDRPTATLTLAQLKDQVVALSLNQWQMRSGAASLLAPNSLISDRYSEFVRRIEGSFELVWNADRSIADFYDQRVSLSLKEDQRIGFSSPEEVWLDATTTQQGSKTQLVVSNVILKSEVTRLTRADFSGSGLNLNFSLVDLAGKSDVISTQFQIKYRTARTGDRFDRFPDYATRYEGIIPADLVSRDNNRFTLNIGKLPIDSQFLRAGLPVEIELFITRSFAGNSAQQEITWRGEIKR
ncbi:MAG TPA: hypothetical protein DDZ80_27095 [Cyanobacteria bacterium UBA8803]|nr:hypothetical protein [Cyanobacteria bacterium UBA9273]HBL61943.1 hypothetical protein [Cyanobacteria bacterium UBA8803]